MPPTHHQPLAVAITGLGAVTPIGIGTPAYIASIRARRSGTRLLDDDEADRARIASTVGATCPAFDPRAVLDDVDLRRLPRLIPMALAAAREALAQADLDPARDEDAARRTALVLGTGGGGIDFTLEQAARFARGEGNSLWTITNATHGNLAGELSIRLGLRGPSHCISDGCASSSNAIGLARTLLGEHRPGAPDAVLVVGADAHIRAETLASMELLKVLSTRRCTTPDEAATACRPFCKTRDGFILGEGAWAMVLERVSAADRAARTTIARVLGYASTCDAYHRVRPDPDARESARAIRLAIEDAQLEPEDIQIVHFHGTGTPTNDVHETRAVRLAFAHHAQALVGHSVKSMIGHPQGASGIAAAVATIGALANLDRNPAGPFAPPTINRSEPDPECDLDITSDGPRPTDAHLALINCLAFGAKNAALIVEV